MASSSKNVPSDAMMELLSPDGYYTYLQIPKPALAQVQQSGEPPEFDDEAVKKSYRKLSRKHHPDKPGGDADTFRLLNRAHKVLSTQKLREQYNILGIDLDDDEDKHEEEAEGESSTGSSGTAQGIVHEIANMILTGIVQLGVRTLMMAGVSLLLVRWPYTVYPSMLFLLYIAFTLLRQVQKKTAQLVDIWPPLLIALGVFCMYRGRQSKDADADDESSWTWLFWLGETLVIGMFTYNSVSIPKSPIVLAGVTVVAGILALMLRGHVWNYVIVVGLEFGLALFVALAFPVMEMILEAVLNEKLKAVGDKVRAHHTHMVAYYQNKK